MPTPQSLDLEQQRKACDLHDEGLSYRAIAKRIGKCSHMAIGRLLQGRTRAPRPKPANKKKKVAKKKSKARAQKAPAEKAPARPDPPTEPDFPPEWSLDGLIRLGIPQAVAMVAIDGADYPDGSGNPTKLEAQARTCEYGTMFWKMKHAPGQSASALIKALDTMRSLDNTRYYQAMLKTLGEGTAQFPPKPRIVRRKKEA